jgi:hypothetical protein
MATQDEMEIFYNTVFEVDNEDTMVALLTQGFGTMAHFDRISLEDVTHMIASIRKPGGTIDIGGGFNIPNHGTGIAPELELLLKQFWLYTRRLYMTQRTPNFATGEGVPTLEGLKEYQDYVVTLKTKISRDIPQPSLFPGTGDRTKKWFESFDDWAALTLGSSGIPVLYVLHKKYAIEVHDNHWEAMDNPDLDFTARGQHPSLGVRATYWRSNNSIVWNLLKTLVHPIKDSTWIEPFETRKDGHGAYWALNLPPWAQVSPKHLKPVLIRSFKTSALMERIGT